MAKIRWDLYKTETRPRQDRDKAEKAEREMRLNQGRVMAEIKPRQDRDKSETWPRLDETDTRPRNLTVLKLSRLLQHFEILLSRLSADSTERWLSRPVWERHLHSRLLKHIYVEGFWNTFMYVVDFWDCQPKLFMVFRDLPYQDFRGMLGHVSVSGTTVLIHPCLVFMVIWLCKGPLRLLRPIKVLSRLVLTCWDLLSGFS